MSMPNLTNNGSNNGLKKWEILLHSKGGYLSKQIDKINQIHDDKFGKLDLPKNLQSISNSSFAEIKKMQSDILGFK